MTLPLTCTASPPESGNRVHLDARLAGQHAGSLLWDRDTGEIEAVYVPPRLRRQGIATALLQACRDAAEAGGYPPPRVTGARTALGHAWLTAHGMGEWPPSWSEPMTPPEDAAGVDRRLLIVDDPAALAAGVRAACPADVGDDELAELIDIACGPSRGARLRRTASPT